MKPFLFFLLAIVLASSVHAQSTGSSRYWKKLHTCMSGSFSSQKQSEADSDYFDIRLRMVPIWSISDTDFYLYVEQAMAQKTDKPYRQRVYHVVKNDDTHFTSYIFLISNQDQWIGRKKGDPFFDTMSKDSLKLKEGCEVKLVWNNAKNCFEGETGKGTCPSDRANAAYATSSVNINKQRMISWDQGWDKQGVQVWGATKGGYIFQKLKHD